MVVEEPELPDPRLLLLAADEEEELGLEELFTDVPELVDGLTVALLEEELFSVGVTDGRTVTLLGLSVDELELLGRVVVVEFVVGRLPDPSVVDVGRLLLDELGRSFDGRVVVVGRLPSVADEPGRLLLDEPGRSPEGRVDVGRLLCCSAADVPGRPLLDDPGRSPEGLLGLGRLLLLFGRLLLFGL